MNRWPVVSVISPVFNARKALERLLASLRAQTYPRDRVQIILVDNDSTDGSWEWISAQPTVLALRETAHQTPGAPRNRGLRAAAGEVIALIDADCWAHPEWLERGVGRLLEDKVDRVGGRVQFAFSSHPNFYELFDSNVNFRQKAFVERKWSGTGNLFFRRRLIDEIGALDPTLRSAMDYEFGVRASEHGKTLAFADDAIVYHYARRSFKSLFTKFMRTGYGAGQLYRKHGYFATSVFYRKANYRPVYHMSRDWEHPERLTLRERVAIDLFWNVLRMASNIGNAAGYFDLLGFEKERRA